jgi:hypothetical protein
MFGQQQDDNDDEEFHFDLLRTASLTETSMCFNCREQTGDEKTDLRLGCKCLVHQSCFVQYLKSIVKDRMTTHALDMSAAKVKGIHCPNYNSNAALNECSYEESSSGGEVEFYLITTRDLIRIVEISGLNSSEEESEKFSKEDLDKLTEWLSELGNVTPSSSDEFCSIIEHTTKACPKCRFRQSHFLGHGCHAVNCGVCYVMRCYKCGNENCTCGSSHSMCLPLQGLADINDYIVKTPYPYDRRCGCAVCFDCRKGKPCGTCSGNCGVCTGIINPGPEEEGIDGWEVVLSFYLSNAL